MTIHFHNLTNHSHCETAGLLESSALQSQVTNTATTYEMTPQNPPAMSNTQTQHNYINVETHSFNCKKWFGYSSVANISRSRLLAFVLLALLVICGPKPAVFLVNADYLSRQEYMSGEESNLAPHLGSPFHTCSDEVPFKEDSAFIGRFGEIEAIHQVLKLENPRTTARQRRLVLEGPVGVGKTRLAVAYAKRWANEYGKVLWIDAASEAMTRGSFSFIHDCLVEHGLVRSFINEGVVDIVKRWLSNKDNERWLLVFDGYVESECFDINSYYPEAAHGSILISTRHSDDVNATKIKLSTFDDDDLGMQIIKSNSERRDVYNDYYARQLASALGGIPAALSTVGVYLRYSEWTFEHYFHAYHSLLSTPPRHTLSSGEETQTLYATWDLLLQHLQHHDHVAEQLLTLLALVGRSHVWFGFFNSQPDRDVPPWLLHISYDKVEFDTTMHRLVDYGFVEVQSNLQVYFIRESIREWILSKSTDHIQPWVYEFILSSILKSVNGRRDLQDLSFTRLVPHAVELAHTRFSFVLQENNEDRIEEIRTIYFLLKRHKQFAEAKDILDGTLAWYEQTFGLEHPSTLLIATELAQFYDQQDRDVESEHLYKQVLARCIKGLGDGHVLTARVLMFLGEFYATRNDRSQAEDIYLQALVEFEKSQGDRHEETLCMVYRLGLFYMNTGRLMEAWRFFQRGYDVSLEVLGADHESTLDTTYKLAQVYYLQGRHVEAERMYETAMLGYEQALGTNHLSTISVSRDLGRFYNLFGKQADAERMYSQAVSGAETLLGPNHEDTLDVLTSLAQIYRDQGKLNEAERALWRVITGHQAVSGPEHVATLQAAAKLGRLYHQQGRMAEAERMLYQVFTGSTRATGGDYLDFVNAANLLANFYWNRDRTREAEQVYLQSLFESEKQARKPNDGTAAVTRFLGSLYRAVGRYAEAEKMSLRALAESRLLYGDFSPRMIQMVQDLAQLYLNYGTEHQLQHVESQFPHLDFGYDKNSPDAFKQLF